ncbi:LPS export ABC transporter periplasmic protein LptC [Mucilaginibacter sp. 14171R-50]|uniref:LPS export ABC transporter periplasmic protein LptC n=1 Tax=Mucilaginibacter sp. 14171R-50 TaxID=2703789 RepID=UPI00138BCC1D|nr:LPS export ABC transporter periplasmic protein LptC [Mucilaginibacter sp. 14171R-50]QHS54499.1 LPS export ABC transporter periplasmic protein LptC [Mucilaginibacter sp. 14171R-50]
MQNRLKQLCIYLPVVFTGIFFTACENDINKVKAIAAADATKPIQRTTGVNMILSDSGIVKAQLTAPLLIEYATKKNPYQVMPNGVKVILYTPKVTEEANIIADTGYYYGQKELVIFKKHVVATRSDGSVYRSEELIWDMKKKQAYSNQKVVMTKPNGDEMTGTSFVTDDKLQNPKFQNSTAIIHVDGSLAQ